MPTTRRNNEAELTFSQQNTLRYHTRTTSFPIGTRDWERLKAMIEGYSRTSVVWWSVFAFFLSSFLGTLLTYLTVIDSTNKYKTIFLVLSGIFGACSFMSFIFALVQNKSEGNTKKNIIQMKKIE